MTNHNLDTCLRLVADQYRRQIIHHLRHEANGTTTFDDLVEQISSQASDFKNDPPQGREKIAIQLHHIHLPKLANYGVIEFEHTTRVVRYHSDAQVETVLDSLPRDVSLSSP